MLKDKFIEGMSRSASTVSVVTSDGPAGRAGVTVSTLCSVSAEPPQLLVCVHHKSSACDIIRENGRFCVNVLRDEQTDVSDTFAGRLEAPGGDKFACADWSDLATGSPALDGALVAYDCHLAYYVRCGSHIIFIGDVVDVAIAEDCEDDNCRALVYANRAYAAAEPLAA
ncbi:MAG: flavin reductase family protein [Alphaproteobacteria bacterium]